MKTLYLLRHAKSDWTADFGTDFERPLNRRGKRAAKAIGEFLAQAGRTPEYVLCSSSVRTRRTLKRVMAAAEWEPAVEHLDELYTGNPRHVLATVRGVSKRVDSLMVVGHETAMSETLAQLVGGGDFRFPTAAVACIQLEIRRWKDLEPGVGQLIFLVPPRLL